MFDLTDKALDQMPFTVKVPINFALETIPTARRNNGISTGFSDLFNKRA